MGKQRNRELGRGQAHIFSRVRRSTKASRTLSFGGCDQSRGSLT